MRSCARNVEVKTVLNQTWPIQAEEDLMDPIGNSRTKKIKSKPCLIDREKIKPNQTWPST